MSEKFCRNAIFDNIGHVYKIQAQTRTFSFSNLSALCQPENILSAKLALFFSNVSISLKESRSENVQSCVRYD